MKPFKEFNTRFRDMSPLGFYACVNKNGEWFDSAYSFATAVHWCCCDSGEFNLSTEEEFNWMDTKGKGIGFAIVHSSILEQMYNAGLIK